MTEAEAYERQSYLLREHGYFTGVVKSVDRNGEVTYSLVADIEDTDMYSLDLSYC